VALLLETHLNPHERFYIPNYHFYRTDRFPGRKRGNVFTVRKGIPHNHVDLPPLVSVEATGVCISIGNCEVLLAAIYKSPSRGWNNTDIIGLLSCRRKSISAGDLNAKNPFWNSIVSNHSGVKVLNLRYGPGINPSLRKLERLKFLLAETLNHVTFLRR
jgi:hypothetical protein